MDMSNLTLANQNLCEINPLICGEQYCESMHDFGPMSRSYWLLHYVVSGKGCFTVHGKTYSVEQSQCFVIRPYEITYYKADQKQPWHYIWIGFESGIQLPSLLQNDVFPAANYGHIFAAMLEACHISAGREAYLCGKIWELLAALLATETMEKSTASNYVLLAKTCIEAEYMRGITVAEIARRLNLDRSYFSTLFKRHTSKSPQQYLNDFRLQKAAELMTEHGYTPTMAALSTGYPDIFSFSRMFKRHYGISPSGYLATKSRE